MYNLDMKFEWDKNKSVLNHQKHGIDFNTAMRIWDDPNRIEILAPYPLEDRLIIIGAYLKKLWTVVYTVRSGKIRIISVRRARKQEARLYEKENIGTHQQRV
jgi:uncharacterized DUF497 family protein